MEKSKSSAGDAVESEVERIVREFQKERQPLLSYIRALTCDGDKADDLIQDISVVVLRKANAGERPENLPAWCRGIARNLLLRERRDNQRLVYFNSENWIALVDRAFEENEPQPEEHRGTLRKCIDKMGDSARELIDLRYTQALKLKDIARRLKRSELAVQVSLSRLRKSLRQCMQRGGAAMESAG
jgi:RNA polymerase sigma-70 factor (ECF subfamily)